MPEQVILTLNAGSSSLKFALFTSARQPKLLWSGAIDRIGLPGAHFQLSDARKTVVIDEPGTLDSAANKTGMGVISKPDTDVMVGARATDEENMIASHIAAKLAADSVPQPVCAEG